MNTLLDILQAVGVGAAAALSPFFAVAVVILLAALHLGLNPDGTEFEFASGIAAVVVALIVIVQSLILTFTRGGTRFRVAADRPHAITLYTVVAVVLGAVAGAVAMGAENREPLIGALIGAAFAAIVAPAAASLLSGVAGRIEAKEQRKPATADVNPHAEDASRNVLAFGTDATSAGAVALALLIPPTAIVLPLLSIAILAGNRRREQRKHEGLRVLR